jgi:hypothetical protein
VVDACAQVPPQGIEVSANNKAALERVGSMKDEPTSTRTTPCLTLSAVIKPAWPAATWSNEPTAPLNQATTQNAAM